MISKKTQSLLLLMIFGILLMSCSGHNTAERSTSFKVKTQNENDCEVIKKRINDYAAELEFNVRIEQKSKSEILVQINRFISSDKLNNLIHLNGGLFVSDELEKFSPNDFKISKDAFYQTISLQFSEHKRVELNEFTKRNYRKNIAIYIEDSLIASPYIQDSIIENKSLSITFGKNSTYDYNLLNAILMIPFKKKGNIEMSNHVLNFDQTIISESIIQEYNEIKKNMSFSSKLYDKRMKYLHEFNSYYPIFSKVNSSNFVDFVEASDFKDYNSLKNFLTFVNSETKAYHNGNKSFETTLKDIAPFLDNYIVNSIE